MQHSKDLNIVAKNSNGLVLVEQTKLFTTSRIIAERFGKLHAHVLRSIQGIAESNFGLSDFTERNFTLSEYTDSTGRRLPEYHLTKDGTALLIMGFTGPEAMRFKIEFIEAFNRMEAMLQQVRNLPNQGLQHELELVKMQLAMKDLQLENQNLKDGNDWLKLSNNTNQMCYNMLVEEKKLTKFMA